MKSICMLFSPSWPAFLLVRMSMHLAHLMMYFYYGGTLTLDTWDDATYEEELVYYFKDSYRGQYVSLGTGGTCHKALQLRYRQRLRWKVVSFKENPRLRI